MGEVLAQPLSPYLLVEDVASPGADAASSAKMSSKPGRKAPPSK
jgi:hypothetical protein